MTSIRFSALSLLLACRAPVDSWTSADIEHTDSETRSDTGDSSSVEITLLTGAVEIIPKTEITGSLEFFVGAYNAVTDDLERVDCALGFDVESDAWRSDCEDCEEAYEFIGMNFAVQVNDGACDEYGFSEENLEDFRVSLGFGSDLLYFYDDTSGWEPVAETFYDEGFTRFEWLIEFN